MKNPHNSKAPLGKSQRLNERLKKIKISTLENRRMNKNGEKKTSFRDTLMKGVPQTKSLTSRLKDIDDEEVRTERKASLHSISSDGKSNNDTLLTNLDGGFTIVKHRKRKTNARTGLVNTPEDSISQIQEKNKHNWLYARGMMLSKFQKAASIYKSNPARARMLADEGEQYRFMALQYRIEEADRIFYENNSELLSLSKHRLASYAKQPLMRQGTPTNEYPNMTPVQIDLHGLHVSEGIQQLNCAIEMCREQAREDAFSGRQKKRQHYQKLIVVTGHGENRNNKAITNTPSRSGKLYKSVRQCLKRKGLRFEEMKGSFEVML